MNNNYKEVPNKVTAGENHTTSKAFWPVPPNQQNQTPILNQAHVNSGVHYYLGSYPPQSSNTVLPNFSSRNTQPLGVSQSPKQPFFENNSMIQYSNMNTHNNNNSNNNNNNINMQTFPTYGHFPQQQTPYIPTDYNFTPSASNLMPVNTPFPMMSTVPEFSKYPNIETFQTSIGQSDFGIPQSFTNQHQQQPHQYPMSFTLQYSNPSSKIQELPSYLPLPNISQPQSQPALDINNKRAASLTSVAVQHPRKHSMIDESTNRPLKLHITEVDKLTTKLANNMPPVPFRKLKPSAESMKVEKPKRSRRKSKFSTEQDDIILQMKQDNKSWVEIAEAAGVDSFLTARNRYQVLIGQQGGSSSDCGPEDVLILKKVVDVAETEKMKYLTKEFQKCTGKSCTYKQIRELIRYLFWKDASQFDVHEDYAEELEKLQAFRREEFGDAGVEDVDNKENTDPDFSKKESPTETPK